ncbi:MAG: hypothetical protein IH840_00165 [Candidatus Heimdallarchaeota archaeon]|nr:hypothetical protein [Candidatus Heimdallarchaeota archaeon]
MSKDSQLTQDIRDKAVFYCFDHDKVIVTTPGNFPTHEAACRIVPFDNSMVLEHRELYHKIWLRIADEVIE